MKYLKLIVPLAVVIALLLTVVPAFADDPFGGPPSKTSGNGSTTWGAIYIGDNGCWTGKLAAGSAMWFKADSWAGKKFQVWLDEELAGATKPSGSSVWGAANAYFWGTVPGDQWQPNSIANNPMDANMLEGYALKLYDPDNLQPNFYWPTPNMGLLTTKSGSGPGFSASHTSWANFNPDQPSHLLWNENKWVGWVYMKVYNQMIWDGTFSICTYRAPYVP